MEYQGHTFNPYTSFTLCQTKEVSCTLQGWGKLWQTQSYTPECSAVAEKWDATLDESCPCYTLFKENDISQFDCDMEFEGHRFNPYTVFAMCQSDDSQECGLRGWGKLWETQGDTPECIAIADRWDATQDETCACFTLFDENDINKFNCDIDYKGHTFNPYTAFSMCKRKPKLLLQHEHVKQCTLQGWGNLWLTQGDTPACSAIAQKWDATFEEICPCFTLFNEKDISQFDCDMEYDGHVFNPYEAFKVCQPNVHCSLDNFGTLWKTVESTPQCSAVSGKWNAPKSDVCACYDLFQRNEIMAMNCVMTYEEHDFNPFAVYEWCQSDED
eukprot:UN29468